MPTREAITYFGAGPAALPTDVLKNAASALLDYQGTGLGVSHYYICGVVVFVLRGFSRRIWH